MRPRSTMTPPAPALGIGLALLIACAAPALAYELYPGEKLQPVATPLEGPLVLGGWTRDGRGTVYGLPVKKGERFRFRFEPRNNFVGLVIFDENGGDSDDLFSTQGVAADKVIEAEADSTWIIRPYYARMSPRRGLGAPYTIEVLPVK